MLVRLAFSVAAHLEPEIFILDEVLAVGDHQFHTQCIDRIKEIVNDGRTIILVSHNMSYVRRLAKRTIWLQKGELKEYGPTEDVVNHYEAASSSIGGGRKAHDPGKRASVISWRLVEGVGGEPNVLARSGSACAFEFQAHADEPLQSCRFEFRLSDLDDIPVYVASHHFAGLPLGTSNLLLKLPALPLQPGQYRLETRFYQRHEELDVWHCDPLLIVSGQGLSSEANSDGLLRLDSQFEIRS
jgi:lipopolysaccharide transport system ATP-binding protein